MKKSLLLGAVVLALVSFVGCGGGATTPDNTNVDNNVVDVVTEETTAEGETVAEDATEETTAEGETAAEDATEETTAEGETAEETTEAAAEETTAA